MLFILRLSIFVHRPMRRYLIIMLLIALAFQAPAQEREWRGRSPFKSFRPAYFVGGIPLSGPADRTTAGFKFQFSGILPVWESIAGREGLDLSLGYTQTSVWDFFGASSPFRDNCYSPGIYLSVPLERDALLLGVEHRSNGRPLRGSTGDSFSRSVNYFFVEYGAFFPTGIVLKANLRAGTGWYDDEPTAEVMWRFQGYADLTAGYQDEKWQASATFTPLFGPVGVNIEAALARKVGICSLFLQFNYGYGEVLSSWVRGSHPSPYLRFGVLFGDLF